MVCSGSSMGVGVCFAGGRGTRGRLKTLKTFTVLPGPGISLAEHQRILDPDESPREVDCSIGPEAERFAEKFSGQARVRTEGWGAHQREIFYRVKEELRE